MGKRLIIMFITIILLISPTSTARADTTKEQLNLYISRINKSEEVNVGKYTQLKEKGKTIVSYIDQLNNNMIKYDVRELTYLDGSLRQLKSNMLDIESQSKTVQTNYNSFKIYLKKGNLADALTLLQTDELLRQERGGKIGNTLSLCNNIIATLQNGTGNSKDKDKQPTLGGYLPSNKGVITIPEGK